MKIGSAIAVISIAVSSFCAQGYSQSSATGQSRAAARTFNSDLGFDLSYPTEWIYNDLGPVLPASRLSLDKQSETDAYRRSIECTQNFFSARLGEPRSTFLGTVITTECMGAKPDLDAFTSRAVTALARRYQLGAVQYAVISVHGQNFWVMRTTGTNRQDVTDSETIEYAATALPQGLVYWTAHAKTKQAQSSFEHARLRLSSGIETELIPEGAFESGKTPAEDFTRLGGATSSGTLIKGDAKASHHFLSGVGFSYEVPADFTILDIKEWEASMLEDASGKPAASEPPANRCFRPLLAANPQGDSKLVTIIAYPQGCMGFDADPASLSLSLASATLNLAKKYTLKKPEYSTFSAGGHRIAVMRSVAALKKRPWEQEKYVALLLAPIPNGLAEYFLVGRTRADLDALLATRIRFDDGVETELAPAGTFSDREQPQSAGGARANPFPEDAPQPDLTPTHHFDSGLGFSFEVPQDLGVRNVKQLTELAKAIAAQHPLTGGEATSVRCGQGLLMAGRKDLSRVIAVFAFARECIGFPLEAGNLALVGQSGIVELAKRYEFGHTETGSFSAGKHRLWAMRSSIAPKDPAAPHRFIGVVLVPTPQGVAECMIQADTRADLDALMAVRLRFDDGAETELIPARVFATE